ncbi:UNVERIFIED_CONTAM: hypothetical protein H355_002425, partial [Colinus virginianus]
VGHDPLLVVEDYEDGGIRLKCLSQRLFSEAHLLWTDSKGDNITGTPLSADTSTASVSSSIILKAGSGNSMSCKIIDKLLKTSTESSVAIADAFFPSTSPWLAAFVVILLLSIFLVLAAVYKIRSNNKEVTRAQNAQNEIQQEEQKKKFRDENEDTEKKIENVRNELRFRKARSNAVNITLDQKCKHPSLSIHEEKNRVKCSNKEGTGLRVMVVANESFSENKHYWEVEVGDQSHWELGVVSEKVRNTITNNMQNYLPLNSVFSLQYSQGKYTLTGGEDVNCKQCSVVGVLLDMDNSELSFYDVEKKCPLGRKIIFAEEKQCSHIFLADEVPVTITVDPSVVSVGEQVTLACQLAPSIPSNTSVFWYKEEKGRDAPLCSSSSLDGVVEQCQDGEKCRIKGRWEGRRLLLIIQQVQIADGGVYVCVVSGNAASQEAVTHLDVIGKQGDCYDRAEFRSHQEFFALSIPCSTVEIFLLQF